MGETVRGISWAAPAGLAPTGAEVGSSNSGPWLSSQGQDFELLQPGAPTFQMLSGEDMLPWGVLCSLHSSTRPPTTTRASPSSRLRGAHSLCPPCPSWPCPHPGTLTQATPVWPQPSGSEAQSPAWGPPSTLLCIRCFATPLHLHASVSHSIK